MQVHIFYAQPGWQTTCSLVARLAAVVCGGLQLFGEPSQLFAKDSEPIAISRVLQICPVGMRDEDGKVSIALGRRFIAVSARFDLAVRHILIVDYKGKRIRRLDSSQGSLAADGNSLLYVTSKGVMVWDSDKDRNTELLPLALGDDAICSIAATEDKQTLTVGRSGKIEVWRIKDRTKIHDFVVGEQAAVLALGISADAQTLNAVVHGVGLRRWRLDTYEALQDKKSADTSQGFGFTFIRDCKMIGSGKYGWIMCFIDSRSFKQLSEIEFSSELFERDRDRTVRVAGVGFSQDGKQAVVIGLNGVTVLLDVRERAFSESGRFRLPAAPLTK
jgi:hypothetical protein